MCVRVNQSLAFLYRLQVVCRWQQLFSWETYKSKSLRAPESHTNLLIFFSFIQVKSGLDFIRRILGWKRYRRGPQKAEFISCRRIQSFPHALKSAVVREAIMTDRRVLVSCPVVFVHSCVCVRKCVCGSRTLERALLCKSRRGRSPATHKSMQVCAARAARPRLRPLSMDHIVPLSGYSNTTAARVPEALRILLRAGGICFFPSGNPFHCQTLIPLAYCSLSSSCLSLSLTALDSWHT